MLGILEALYLTGTMIPWFLSNVVLEIMKPADMPTNANFINVDQLDLFKYTH